MKKILTGMILTVMATALAACGNGVAEDREQPQDTGISISADVETDTIQDIQDQETDDTETEAEALKELLAEGPLTIDMSDYGNMEKVGPIGTSLPRNDTNSWNFTRIGKIDWVTREELLDAFGEGNVTVTFSLE